MRLSTDELKRRARESESGNYIWPDVLDRELAAYTEYRDEEIKYTVAYIRGCRTAMGLNLADTLNEFGCPHLEYARVLLAYVNAGERITPEEMRLITRQQCMLKLNKQEFMEYSTREEMYSDQNEDEPWYPYSLGGTNDEGEKTRIEEYDSYARCLVNRYTAEIKWLEIKTPDHSAYRKENMLIIKD